MLLKKFLIGSALTALILPAIANADLVTYNHTKDYSTVKITSSKNHYCSFGGGPMGMFNKFTAPGGVSYTSPAEVKTICQATTGFCEADMYPTKNCDASGVKPIAHLQIDVATLKITKKIILDSNYSIDISGSTVTINKI